MVEAKNAKLNVTVLTHRTPKVTIRVCLFFFFSGPNGRSAMPIGLTINTEDTNTYTQKHTLHAEERVLEHVKSHRGNEPRLPLRPPSAMRPR